MGNLTSALLREQVEYYIPVITWIPQDTNLKPRLTKSEISTEDLERLYQSFEKMWLTFWPVPDPVAPTIVNPEGTLSNQKDQERRFNLWIKSNFNDLVFGNGPTGVLSKIDLPYSLISGIEVNAPDKDIRNKGYEGTYQPEGTVIAMQYITAVINAIVDSKAKPSADDISRVFTELFRIGTLENTIGFFQWITAMQIGPNATGQQASRENANDHSIVSIYEYINIHKVRVQIEIGRNFPFPQDWSYYIKNRKIEVEDTNWSGQCYPDLLPEFRSFKQRGVWPVYNELNVLSSTLKTAIISQSTKSILPDLGTSIDVRKMSKTGLQTIMQDFLSVKREFLIYLEMCAPSVLWFYGIHPLSDYGSFIKSAEYFESTQFLLWLSFGYYIMKAPIFTIYKNTAIVPRVDAPVTIHGWTIPYDFPTSLLGERLTTYFKDTNTTSPFIAVPGFDNMSPDRKAQVTESLKDVTLLWREQLLVDDDFTKMMITYDQVGHLHEFTIPFLYNWFGNLASNRLFVPWDKTWDPFMIQISLFSNLLQSGLDFSSNESSKLAFLYFVILQFRNMIENTSATNRDITRLEHEGYSPESSGSWLYSIEKKKADDQKNKDPSYWVNVPGSEVLYEKRIMDKIFGTWNQSYDSLLPGYSTVTMDQVIPDTPQPTIDASKMTPKEFENAVYNFMKRYPLIPPVEPGIITRINFAKGAKAGDYFNLAEKQWGVYVLWVEANVRAYNNAFYVLPGEALLDKDGKEVFVRDKNGQHIPLLNIPTNIGILADPEHRTKWWAKLFIFPYVIFGNQWQTMLNGFIKDVIETTLAVLQSLWEVTKAILDTILPALPIILLTLAAITGGYFLIEDTVDNYTSRKRKR